MKWFLFFFFQLTNCHFLSSQLFVLAPPLLCTICLMYIGINKEKLSAEWNAPKQKRSIFLLLVSRLFVLQIDQLDCCAEIERPLNERITCVQCFNYGIIKQFHLARSILCPSYYSIKKHHRINQLPNCSASNWRNNDHTSKWEKKWIALIIQQRSITFSSWSNTQKNNGQFELWTLVKWVAPLLQPK